MGGRGRGGGYGGCAGAWICSAWQALHIRERVVTHSSHSIVSHPLPALCSMSLLNDIVTTVLGSVYIALYTRMGQARTYTASRSEVPRRQRKSLRSSLHLPRAWTALAEPDSQFRPPYQLCTLRSCMCLAGCRDWTHLAKASYGVLF